MIYPKHLGQVNYDNDLNEKKTPDKVHTSSDVLRVACSVMYCLLLEAGCGQLSHLNGCLEGLAFDGFQQFHFQYAT
ncbi:hypothetical protein HG66A1_49370 [Gimesia chilikensis]|uniref:Uncharacterized protein n=1 Tax=Gimesia chilikensis TaxID=2605989 RepID=A0A517PUR1_9PLAN|nr:hypothetical protein HG66A1_49370 [Gimesia chilikensis]